MSSETRTETLYYPRHLWTPDLCRENILRLASQGKEKQVRAMIDYCRRRWPEEQFPEPTVNRAPFGLPLPPL